MAGYGSGYMKEPEIEEALQKYYTTIYAQAFSPCGNYLAAASCFGKISIFNLSFLLNLSEDNEIDQELNIQSPQFSFKAHNGPIYALVSTETYLISAGCGDIQGWAWKDLLRKTAKLSWEIPVADYNNQLCTKPNINALSITEPDGVKKLFAGCGDNILRVYDLENLKLNTKFEGHNDYIHCIDICKRDENVCFSGGEDGQLLNWDLRSSNKPVNKIEPHKNDKCNRPKFGKWVGCVAVDDGDDWVVCGGGPTLSLWHLRSLSCAVTFPTPKSCQTSVLFHDDLVISGGTENVMNRWKFNGDDEAKIPTKPLFIYSLVKKETQQNKILCAAGNKHFIDVCPNFKYVEFSLHFQ
ncbi:THO complex subunit 6 [Chamberlinius hualienensis]